MKKNYKYNFAVVIGRFQPLHNEHCRLITHALDIAENVIIVIGSSYSPRTLRNPFTHTERERMIKDVFLSREYDQYRFRFIYQEDHIYNYQKWFNEIYSRVNSIVADYENKNIVYVGCKKDHTSSYLDEIRQHGNNVVLFDNNNKINSTDIRNYYFEDYGFYGNKIDKNVPKYVAEYLNKFYDNSHYKKLSEEYWAVLDSKDMWKDSPYTPTFITTDACVIYKNKILLITRAGNIGNGLLALPGGYLEPHESIIDGTIRELHEETNLDISSICIHETNGNKLNSKYIEKLKNHIKETHVFDYPMRSDRGRIVTHASLIDISGFDFLPKVMASSDASHVAWYDVNNLKRQDFFEDHYDMIQYLLARN